MSKRIVNKIASRCTSIASLLQLINGVRKSRACHSLSWCAGGARGYCSQQLTSFGCQQSADINPFRNVNKCHVAYLGFLGSFFDPSSRIEPEELVLGFLVAVGFAGPLARTAHETGHGWRRGGLVRALLRHDDGQQLSLSRSGQASGCSLEICFKSLPNVSEVTKTKH